MFKVDKKYSRRSENLVLAESENLERELAIRSARMMKEERREEKT